MDLFSRRLLAVLLVIFSTVNLQVKSEGATPCTTRYITNGQCVPIERCRNIHRIVSGRNSPITGIANYIKRAICTLPNVKRSICCEPQEIVKEQAPPPVKQISKPGYTTAESVTPLMKPSSHSNAKLLPNECGMMSSDRISFGNATKVFDYPWMAVLRYNNGTGIVDGCGGTLINERYVLTAAHCIKTKSTVQLVNVRLGEHTKNQDEDCNVYQDEEEDCADPTEDFEIESYIVHPNHNKPPYSNDIALLRLKKDVVMKGHIAPICLPVTPELSTRQLKKLIVTGWGTTENATGSDVLLEAILPIVNNTVCQHKFSKTNVKITEQQVCAGGQNKVDSCKGDSGGPLGFTDVYYNLTRFVQFGIVSFGIASCGQKSVPGVYTRVSSYMDWILDNMKS